MKSINPFPLRIEQDLLEKLRVIADDNSRSLNKEIEYIIKKEVEKYEKEHGEIKVNLD